MKNYLNNRNKGFTLVEIIVALMIFSIVVVVALAALLKIIDANRKAQTTQDAVIGLSFALESMSRELRTGSRLHCVTSSNGAINPTGLTSQACPSGQNRLIVFQSAVTDTTSSPPCRLYYAYLFSGSGPYTIKKATQTKGNNCTSSFTTDSYYDLVSPNVVVTGFQNSVTYNAASQPMASAFIRLTGYAGLTEKVRTNFTVQTSAAPRVQ